MNTQTTTTPKLYIGLDIHKKKWAVHFKTDIADYRGYIMKGVAAVLVARTFASYGWNIIVVNAAGIPRIQKLCVRAFVNAFKFATRMKG